MGSMDELEEDENSGGCLPLGLLIREKTEGRMGAEGARTDFSQHVLVNAGKLWRLEVGQDQRVCFDITIASRPGRVCSSKCL